MARPGRLLTAGILAITLLLGGCIYEAQLAQPVETAAPESLPAAYPLEPGLVLFYRGAGHEWSVTVYDPVIVNGQQLTPVGNSEGGAGYMALSGGWVREHGRRDRNGQAFWPAPRKLMPAAMEPGLSWEYEEIVYTVEATEPVTVAAGRFLTAHRVRVEHGGELFALEWYVPGLGLVRAEDAAGNLTAQLVGTEQGAPAHLR